MTSIIIKKKFCHWNAQGMVLPGHLAPEGYTSASRTCTACMPHCNVLAQEAVAGIVALNHATGLRFLHYEDVAVGVWVSGMRLKFITDWDIGYRFVGHAHEWEPEQLEALKVRPLQLCCPPSYNLLVPQLCQQTG